MFKGVLYLDNLLFKIIKGFQQQKIMVVGDMVADVYLEGRIARISREAPVLILEHESETVLPGGAANVVHNVTTLGGQVHAVGVVGNDAAGHELIRVLAGKSVNTGGIIVDDLRATITKTRVMAGGQATVRQQVVRVDRESKTALDLAAEARLLAYAENILAKMALVVISDYGGHTVTNNIIEYLIQRCRQLSIPCMVDSRYNVMAYKGVTIVKQNESEAAAAIGLKNLDDDGIITAGQTILTQLEADAVLLSRGPDGMTLFERSGRYTHIPVSNKSEVYDVTGAGDTVVAAAVLALAAGASYLAAARLANFAAGVVVRKPGTATATPEELVTAIGEQYENFEV